MAKGEGFKVEKKSSCFNMKFDMFLTVVYKMNLCEGSRGVLTSTAPWSEA